MQGFQRFGMKYWENCNGIALNIEKTEMERGKLPKKRIDSKNKPCYIECIQGQLVRPVRLIR